MSDPLFYHIEYYMRHAFRPAQEQAEQFKEALKSRIHKPPVFDTLIGTGLSGALVVPALANAMGLRWAIVRKDDNSHSSSRIEGTIGERWLFVDDFISSGRTLDRTKQIVRRACPATAYAGFYLYTNGIIEAEISGPRIDEATPIPSDRVAIRDRPIDYFRGVDFETLVMDDRIIDCGAIEKNLGKRFVTADTPTKTPKTKRIKPGKETLADREVQRRKAKGLDYRSMGEDSVGVTL